MPFSVTCDNCQKTLKVPDKAAGKKGKCPRCGTVIRLNAPAETQAVAPEALFTPGSEILDAEPVTDEVPAPEPADDRVPCPACGEQILSTAVKCRYCGEVFDDSSDAAPGSQPNRSRAPVGVQRFKVAVKSSAKDIGSGVFDCVASSTGLVLTRKNRTTVTLPVGVTVRYFGGKKFEATTHDGKTVQVSINMQTKYTHRLTRDMTEFLRGRGPLPALSDYSLPWYFYVTVFLPIGIPILTLGGGIPMVVAGLGVAVNTFIVQKEKWAAALRIVATIAVSAACYVGMYVFILAVLGRLGGSPPPVTHNSPKPAPNRSAPTAIVTPVTPVTPATPNAPRPTRPAPTPAPPTPPVSQIVYQTGSGRTINLIERVNIQRDAQQPEKWSLRGGELLCTQGHFVPRVMFAYKPCEEYDVTIEFTQPNPRNGVGLIIPNPTNGGTFAVVIGTAEGHVLATTVNNADKVIRVESESFVKPDTRHTAVIKVRRDMIECIVDSRVGTKITGDRRKLISTSWFKLDDPTRLGVSCDDVTTFHKIELTEITGDGQLGK